MSHARGRKRSYGRPKFTYNAAANPRRGPEIMVTATTFNETSGHMPSKTLSKRTILWVTLGLFVGSCGGGGGSKPGSAEAGGTCTDGELGCPCYGNLTCNQPLMCSPTLVCTQADDTDGAPGTGGSVVPNGGAGGTTTSPGLGGTPGIDGSAGGITGSGGVPVDAPVGTGGVGPGQGGIPGPGSGGSSGGLPGTGGLRGSGGLPGTGGLPGAGGKPGTGGSMPIDAGAGGSPVDAGPDPVLNGPCAAVGALNCVGHAQKGMMMCDGTKWVPNGACSGSLLCDTTPGPTQGTCVSPLANCASQQPGYSYCSSNTKMTCGPDLLTVWGDTCPYVCTAGQCAGECVPSSRDCNGQIPVTCATNGMWLSGTTCAGDCSKGTCCSASTPTNCNGTCVDLQTSSANCGGCGIVCSTAGGKTCRAGACQCPAGTTDCNGTCVSLTGSSANCGACGNACAGGRTCQSSVCACPAGSLECAGACANVQTDKDNCGACGVSCGTSTCYAGNCGGENLITNGDFSDGSTNWQITQADIGVTFGMSAGSYCVSLPSYSEAYFGWGNSLTSVAIAASYGYTFSYTVSSSDSLYSFQAKIGHTVTPYTVVYSTTTDSPGPTPSTFTHNFTPASSDTSAGIAFYLYAYSTGATVCFDDVSLVRH